MRAGTRLLSFAGAVAVVLVASLAVGHAVSPLDQATTERAGHEHAAHEPTTSAEGAGRTDGANRREQPTTPPVGDGTLISTGGYTLTPEQLSLTPGQPADYRFQVRDENGRPVRGFTPTHERELHLIVVARELTWFAHVHPTRDEHGTWTVPLTLPAAGPYRVFADFAVADGPALVLSADLSAPGPYAPTALPVPALIATVDGYEIALDSAPSSPGSAEVAVRVSRNGEPVTDLAPYLGAYGHLVALRAGDLAYLHVHPTGVPGDGTTRPGPDVLFDVELPTAGDYRLFFDFEHDGRVRTAAFTVRVGAEPAGTAHGPDETRRPAPPAPQRHDEGDSDDVHQH